MSFEFRTILLVVYTIKLLEDLFIEPQLRWLLNYYIRRSDDLILSLQGGRKYWHPCPFTFEISNVKHAIPLG